LKSFAFTQKELRDSLGSKALLQDTPQMNNQSYRLAQVSATCGSLAPLKWLSKFDKTSNLKVHLIIIRIVSITF